MALYRNVSWDELDSLGVGMPRPNQTRVYDALGRNTGTDSNDNFFVKRGKSLENAFGTTGAALVSLVDTSIEDAKANARSDNIANRLDEIARKYGYADRGEYWDALSAAEESGNTDELNRLDNTIGAEMREFTSANAKEADQAAKDWKNYRENSYVGQKINQDRGKFAGSAINTLSTMADVALPAAGVAFNSIQGGVEGIADELEQNGLENFDWGRAGQNALIGATTGAVTGALNKGLSNKLAKNGGNLFKGGNKLTQGLNNLGSQTALGRVGSTLATGASRGALSGAVGGATGAGLSAAMNGQDVLGSAVQGAVQGAQQGALAGGVMAGANMVASKTPGIGDAMRKFNEAGEDWNARKANGESFGERLANTWDESTTKAIGNKIAESKLGQRVGEDWNAVKQGFKDVGDTIYDKVVNRGAIERLAKGIEYGADGNIKFARMSKDVFDDINSIRSQNGLDPITRRQVTAYKNAINNNLNNRVNEGLSPREVAQIAFNSLTSDNSRGIPGYYDNQVAISAPGIKNDYDSSVIGLASDGGTSIKSIEPRTKNQVRLFESQGQQKIGPNSQLGFSLADESQPTSDFIVPQNRQNVNDFDYVFEDARGNKVRLPELRTELNPDNSTVIANSDLIDTPVRGRMYDRMSNDDFINYAEQNGWKLVESPYQGMSGSEMLNTMARNAGFDDYNAAVRRFTDTGESVKGTDIVDWMERMATKATPETELYRTLAGETDNKPFLAYGESDLGNRTRRGMLADSLERFGNTLEGAQTNVTRAAAKDLGIESTGKVVENVRKKTGITNLETQAKIAKELTGGENSLMDNVQRNALSAREDGKVYKVDTTDLVNDIDDIVNKYADTNMFGTAKSRDNFVANLKKDIGNMDTDVLSISNRMKANAADLRGKGVAAATPSDSAKAKIYTEVASRLDDLSYNAIPQENVDAMFDATVSEMRGRATQAADNGNKDVAKAYNKLADSLDAEPRTIKAYRSFKKDFVDTSKISDLTAQAENGAASQMGRSFGGGLKRFASTVAQRPINTALAKVGGAINSVADRIGGERTITPTETTVTTQPVVETSYNPATKIYEAIGRTEGLTNAEQARTANYLTDAVQDTNAQNSVLTNTMPTTASTSLYNSLYSNNNLNTTGISDIANTANITDTTSTTTGTGSNTYFQPTGDYWTDILAKAMSAAIDADDVTAFASLYGMYQDSLANLQKSSTGKDYTDVTTWNSSDRTKLLSAQNAMDQIDQLENAYYNATGGDGGNFLQGNLRSLAANISGGNLDASANNYNKLAESVGMGIVKNLINLGVTEADAKRYLEYLPALTDTKEQAAQKLDTLRNIYQSQINNLYSAYGL